MPRPAATATAPPPAETAVTDAYQAYQATVAARQVSEAQTVVARGQRPSTSGYFIDTSYPFPQDMPLGKVATVVDLIDSGDITDQDLSWSLNVSTQQGNYAANAAAYLGLVDRDKNTTPNTLSLTDAGERFLASSPSERLAILKTLVQQMSDDDLDSRDYADTTKEYRKDTAARWVARTEADGAEHSLASTASQAVQRSRETSRPPRQRPRTSEPVYTVCQGCFMTLPASGLCSNCD